MENLTRRDRERLVREEEIISAAEKIFCQKGFEDSSMDEIAKEAEFTKKTLYQYFENKEDLYFAVVLKGFKRLFSYLSEEYKGDHNGYMKIRNCCRRLLQFYKDNPETFRLIGYAGHVKKKSAQEGQNSDEFVKVDTAMFQSFAGMIADGKADGSINECIDTEKTTYSLVFLMTGFLNQLSVTGDTFTGHFSLNIDDFSTYTIDLLLGALKNNKEF